MQEPDLQTLQQDAKALSSVLIALQKLKPKDANFLEQLKRAISRLPDGSTASTVLDDLSRRATALLEQEAAQRIKDFRSHEATFVRSMQGSGVPVREFSSSWRIGAVEVELQREESRVRCAYNRDVILPWRPVSGEADLHSALGDAVTLLDTHAIPIDELVPLIERAHDDAVRHVPASKDSGLVPILELLRSLRIERFRADLASGQPGKSLRNHELPMWALLHNLDRYRDHTAKNDVSPRVGFQTGSQQEQSQGKSVTLNGLDAMQDYQTYTYAVRRG